jgi:hypothetical protein
MNSKSPKNYFPANCLIRLGPWLVALGCGHLLVSEAGAQLFTNLQAFSNRLSAGDPSVRSMMEGPKGVAVAHLDDDGRPDLALANLDGTVTVYFGREGAKWSSPLHLNTDTNELRGIVCADLTGDGRADIAAAAPYAGAIYLFANLGGGSFALPTAIPAWRGARNLAAGDFNGDGILDLAVAGTTNGIRYYRGTGAGNFVVQNDIATLAFTDADEIDFPKPLYALEVFRPQGQSRDELVVTHTDAEQIWVLATGAGGGESPLSVQGTLENEQVYALEVGAVTQPASSNRLDLVTAHRNLGTVEIHQGTSGAKRFEEAPAQVINVPGGPRAVKLLDLDGDGWNDLAVVLRNFDRVLTYHNSNGVLFATTEANVGCSPREMDVGDFNNDGRPDLAVMNRGSRDVSVLLTHPGQTGFTALDQIYQVDGEVTGLAVQDFNGDGRDDVIQLHRASGEMSVRLSDTNGFLGPPRFYQIGVSPSAQSMADVNNDGVLDMLTANLAGSVSVRLGRGDGTFGEEMTYRLPAESEGALFALVAADFDNDTKIDLAAGYYDCRIAFFKGHGNGTFTFTKTHFFTIEARTMVTGDFDKDGDTDLAGAGWKGELVVLENKGDLLTTDTLTRSTYPITFGPMAIKTIDDNNDGDLDIVVGGQEGANIYLGGPGMSFVLKTNGAPSVNFSASAIASADFDGDGDVDLAVGCQILSCLTIFTLDTNQVYAPSVTVAVPSSRFLATGDLDGDGKPDLVGSGSVLWTALSSRAARPRPPSELQAPRPTLPRPVINEILAINTGVPIDQDGRRFTDFVELFNGGAASISLVGWKLRLIAPDDSGARATNDFVFPATAFFGRESRLVVYFSETIRSPYHTGFKLPGAGGALCLLNPDDVEIDRVDYPAQQENVSYTRYKDGLASFTFNPYPSPGRPNVDNGPLEPVLKLDGFDLATLQPNTPIRFYATGRDDVGIVSVSIMYQRLDVPDDQAHRIFLVDDGQHNDGGRLDGLFAGELEGGLPAGAEIQFYIEVIDLTDQTVILPDEPVFARRGEPITLYTVSVGTPHPPLEISELVAYNTRGLTDERGTNADWVEIRNYSANPVSLTGVALSQKFFAGNARYTFPTNRVLAPGEHLVVFCDDNPAAGPYHAPFKINRDGGELNLTCLANNGARCLIDQVVFGAQTNDVAWARLGRSGTWRRSVPTPRTANVPGTWLGLVETNGAFTLAFPTSPNVAYTIEQTDSLNPPGWTPLPAVQGDGLEKVITQPMTHHRFFRVRRGN